MEFKKNEIMFWERQILVILCLLVAALLMIIVPKGIFLTTSVLLLIVLVCQNILEERICIDEKEIICRKGKKIYWRCKWSEIEELRIGNRYRNPSVEIITRNNIVAGVSGTAEKYFQLGMTAKKALRKYGIKRQGTVLCVDRSHLSKTEQLTEDRGRFSVLRGDCSSKPNN